MIYVILGQTASGKTKLALKLAREFNMPIISADAYQCYKEMDIGTDKPKKTDLKGISYHFIDIYNIDDSSPSLYKYQIEGRKLLNEYISKKQDVIITGGTFLYIKALLFNYALSDEIKGNKYDLLSLSDLQKQLLERNKDIYNSIDINNPRRLIRALELLDNGKNKIELEKENNNVPLYPCKFFQIKMDKDKVNSLIDKRIDLMFEKGLEKEVTSILKKYPNNLKSLQAIGYKEFIDGKNNNCSLEQIKKNIKIHTHQYAKKQRTFLNHQFDNQIIESSDTIYNLIKQNVLLKKRTNLLLSSHVINQIEKSKVLLAGLGGVGSIISSCLVRSGFNDITLIDKDVVEESNLNRQIMYDLNDINKKKILVCSYKLKQISPLINIDYYDTNIKEISNLPNAKYDIIIDCIDDVIGKTALYLKSKIDNAIFITSCGSGFHLDSTKFNYGKLSKANDKLAKSFKAELIKNNIKNEEIDNIDCVFPIDAKIKTYQNNTTIPSISSATNASGLAIISLLFKILERRINNGEKNL